MTKKVTANHEHLEAHRRSPELQARIRSTVTFKRPKILWRQRLTLLSFCNLVVAAGGCSDEEIDQDAVDLCVEHNDYINDCSEDSFGPDSSERDCRDSFGQPGSDACKEANLGLFSCRLSLTCAELRGPEACQEEIDQIATACG